jgi:hypothetical protein
LLADLVRTCPRLADKFGAAAWLAPDPVPDDGVLIVNKS